LDMEQHIIMTSIMRLSPGLNREMVILSINVKQYWNHNGWRV